LLREDEGVKGKLGVREPADGRDQSAREIGREGASEGSSESRAG
jgi:hypothetical protein